MLNKIYEMLDKRYTHRGDELRQYDDNGIHISTAIEDMFREEGFKNYEFSVDSETVFSSPAVDIAYVSIAYIESGKLHHDVLVIED